ncbi:MAG TPA: hypothetical protein VF837_05230, partial [Patescibacteria group bacterium]
DRSERYCSLRLMRVIDNNFGDEDKAKISYINSYREIGETLTKLRVEGKQAEIVIVDDYKLSGSKAIGLAGNMINSLENSGIPKEEAAKMMEMMFAAGYTDDSEGVKLPTNEQIKVFLANGVPRRIEVGGVMRTRGITGSHCSTDYNFTDLCGKIDDFYNQRGLNVIKPALTQIEPIYGSREARHDLEDKGLREEFNTYSRKYSIGG